MSQCHNVTMRCLFLILVDSFLLFFWCGWQPFSWTGWHIPKIVDNFTERVDTFLERLTITKLAACIPSVDGVCETFLVYNYVMVKFRLIRRHHSSCSALLRKRRPFGSSDYDFRLNHAGCFWTILWKQKRKWETHCSPSASKTKLTSAGVNVQHD